MNLRIKFVVITLVILFLEGIIHPCLSDASIEIYLPRKSGDSVQINNISGTQADTLPLAKCNIVSDSPIVGMLDSLIQIKYFRGYYFNSDTSFLNVYQFPFDTMPTYSDSVYDARIAWLDKITPIDLTFNQDVRQFINLYAVQKRQLTSRVLGLAEIYFPLFEEQLDRFNLPLELKYLAVVESALNPTAGSRVGAKGLWQFMYNTGKLYNLKVTSYVDERFDPYKSTIAACEHLCDLYEIYGDWFLVMAAYNAGAGNVNKAIRRAGNVMNYWAIQPFLPRETRGYVPAFIAVYYIMNFAPEHNLYPAHPGILYNGIDTVTVHEVLSFEQISEMLNVPLEDLYFLNPAFKTGVFPSINNETYTLRLPKEYIGDFINNEQALYLYKTQKGIDRDKLLAQIKQIKEQKYHTVKSGENLGIIAQKYHCQVSDLKRWNNLKGNMIYQGQRLIVYHPVSVAGIRPATHVKSEGSPVLNSSDSEQSEGQNNTHIVQSGETLGTISARYGCSVDDLIKWNNLKNNIIYPTQVLKLTDSLNVSSSVAVAESSREEQSENAVNPTTEYIYHIIQPGETLWDISHLYEGTSVEQIIKLNNITNTRRLKPGQKIKIARIS
ncbi:MAG: LysM peptidoglycan-binding domain-containing protein [Bacteroidetes bacterium]|nr:LysM peptidoglycan-binding domain-containing protein [Bacteroidota bacterium]